jgi:O-antigen/teichoic acid export membrane protein
MLGGLLSARVLLPQGRGELAAVMLWPAVLATVGSLGVIDAATYFTADRGEDRSKVWTSTLALTAGLSGLLMAIGYFVVPLALSGYGSAVIHTSRVYLAFIPSYLVTLALMSMLLGQLRFVDYNALRVFINVAAVAGMVACFLTGHASVFSFAMSFLGAHVLTGIAAFSMVSRHGWFGSLPDALMARRLVAYGLRSHAGTVATLLNLRLDQMLLSVFLRPSILGLYVVAVTISAVTALAATTIALVAFPSIAKMETLEAKSGALGRYLRWTAILTGLVAAALYALAPWVVHFFFGTAFVPATPAARILIVAAFPMACNSVLAAGLKGLNRPLTASLAEILSLSVTAVALAILLPRYEILGAAWASLLAYTASCVFMTWSVRRHLGTTLTQLFRPTQEDWHRVLAGLAYARTGFHANR